MQRTIIQRPRTGQIVDATLHHLLQRVYQGRGVNHPSELETGLAQLHPWQTLSNIDHASALLYQAWLEQKRVLVIGDFDADGATATTIALRALKSLGFQSVNFLVPNRFTYGYGLTPEIVDAAAHFSPQLIITVDNGIASHRGVETAKAKGIQVLITDHHLPGPTLPAADVIVNPNLPEDTFPSKAMAGCGVIFYVMLALRASLRAHHHFNETLPEPNLAELLDLVALGTVADVVPFDQNNRIFVHQGIKRIQAKHCCPGLLALLEVAGRQPEQISATDLAYALAPRLNAAGRLDDMSLGIHCLLTDDLEEARRIATQLNNLNQERRTIETQMQQEAWRNLSYDSFHTINAQLPAGICLFDEKWHQGVIGILAGRIKEKLHRPVIAFAKVSDTELKGSARSIPGIHIRDILDYIATRHPDLLEKFGGHAMAAGLSLKQTHFSRFARVFNAAIEKYSTPDILKAQVLTDGELQLTDISLELATLLRQSGPWGTAFPEPLFDNHFQLLQQTLLADKHLKMRLSLPGHSTILDAIAFSVDREQWPNYQANTIHAVYRLDINEYRGLRKVQLIIDQFDATPTLPQL
ncbi:MAG: single-stranded-DNA-specific exonuclease RecJ [Gammaproteobacteria bacterium]|nr:single-stranded-DNA-specific exonuclease RecJ [Gammaproteobacteria bacterium]